MSDALRISFIQGVITSNNTPVVDDTVVSNKNLQAENANEIQIVATEQVETENKTTLENQADSEPLLTFKAQESELSQPQEETYDFSDPQTKEEKLAYIYTTFQKSCDEQGFLGKISDGVKNILNRPNSLKNIQKAIDSLDENSTDEEIDAVMQKIEKYNSNQDSVVKATTNTAAMLAGGAVGAKAGAAIGTLLPIPVLGTAAGMLIGAGVGALTSVVLNQVENMTDKVKGNSWQNDKNILKEAGEGALSGGSAVAMGAITNAVKGATMAKLGLKSVKVDIDGKRVMAALAQDGISANTSSTIAKTALATAAGTATSSAAIADGMYLLDVATDKDKKFSIRDLLTTTGISAGMGAALGMISGSIEGKAAAGKVNYNAESSRLLDRETADWFNSIPDADSSTTASAASSSVNYTRTSYGTPDISDYVQQKLREMSNLPGARRANDLAAKEARRLLQELASEYGNNM